MSAPFTGASATPAPTSGAASAPLHDATVQPPVDAQVAETPAWLAEHPTPPARAASPSDRAPTDDAGRPAVPTSPRTHQPVAPRPEARPRIVQDPVILGLTRHSRSKLGSRLFTLFFVFVYLIIVVQLIWSILRG